MKVITPQLQALFATGQYNYCKLFQFSPIGSAPLYYSSGDVDIFIPNYTPYVTEDGVTVYETEDGTQDYVEEASSGGQLYTAGKSTGPYFDRKDNKAKMHCKIGLDVDQLTFDVIPGNAQIDGTSFLDAIGEGFFDGCEVIYYGCYWPKQTYTSQVIPTGTIMKFVGNVAQVDSSRNLATFTINSYLELLNQNLPINLYQTTCNNNLYDASCTLSASNFTSASSALSGSTNSTINANLSEQTGYYSLGTIQFTSGENEGVSRTVKLHTLSNPSTVTLILPLPSTPAPGDTFNIWPGCDKLLQTCAVKFANLSNFRGFPFIPTPENAS